MKKWKRLLSFVLCLCLIVGTNRIHLLAGSETQIEHEGGRTGTDGIRVSKTVSGTDTENVFDITLKVETDTNVKKVYEKPPASVVVVMDISNTMFTGSSTKKPYDEAMESLKKFIEKYYNDSRDAVVPRELAIVTFNTNAQTQVGLTNCSTTTLTSGNIYKKVEDGIKDTIGNRSSYATSNSRYTNIEAGLQLADNILKKSSTQNKYVIMLTDGMPTTYSKDHSNTSTTGIAGYSPVSGGGATNKDGVFWSALDKCYCSGGTSYSDKAAQYAETKAKAMKNAGTKIYSMGINVDATTIESIRNKGLDYVIDSRTTDTSKFVIKRSKPKLFNSDYKTWLFREIGSNYYHDGDNASEMDTVYNEVFKDMTKLSEETISTSWRITDPMNNEGLLSKNIEFLGFYDKSNVIKSSLTGTASVGGENTATFTGSSENIGWSIHESGYEETISGNTKTYTYELKYRIRLKNEMNGFESNVAVPTNGKTTLSYTVNDNGTVKNGTIDFDIPKVKGYLADFSFIKVDELNNEPLQGAEFTLTHKSNCSVCDEIGKNIIIDNQTLVSGAAGNVAFTNIPSGHEYIMTETVSPEGYKVNSKEYEVIVSNGKVTIDGVNAESFKQLNNAPKTFKLNYVVVTPAADCPDAVKTTATPALKSNIPYNRDITLEATLSTTADKKGDIPGTWVFSGWYDNEGCTGTTITEKNIKKDETVYGKWEFTPTTYKVEYVVTPDPVYGVPKDVTIPEDASIYDYMDKVTVKPNLVTEWKTSDGTPTGKPGEWVFVPWDKSDFPITEDTVITGKWIFEPAYTLKYVIVTTENPDPSVTTPTPDKTTDIPENTLMPLEGPLTTTSGMKNGVTGTWKFSGWYDNEGCTGTPLGTSILINKNEIVYGRWDFEPNTHKVTYVVKPDPKYGVPKDTDTPIDDRDYNHNALVEVVPDLKTLWTTSDGTSTGIPGVWKFTPWDKDDFNIIEDTTITGEWEFLPNLYLQYIIVSTENPDSTKTDTTPATVTGLLLDKEQKIAGGLTTKDGAKDGIPGTWIFSGWNDSYNTTTKELTGNKVGPTIIMTKNETVYGRWDFIPKTYNVTYEVIPDPIINKMPTDVIVPKDKVYNFNDSVTVEPDLKTGWKTSDGTPTGIPGKWEFTPWDKEDFKIKEDTKITGKWKFTQYTYTLNYVIVSKDNPNSTKTDVTPSTVTNIAYDTNQSIEVALKTTDTYKNGVPGTWKFSGWYEKSDCTGTTVTVKNIRKNETVYGKWEFIPDTYKVNYIVTGDSKYGIPSDGVAPSDGTDYAYKQLVKVKDDLKTGWETSDGKSTGIPGIWKFTSWDKRQDFNIVQDTNIYGKWTFIPTKYMLNYVIVSTDNPLSDKTKPTPSDVNGISYNTNIKLKAKLTTTDNQKDGVPGTWKFSGWYETSDCMGTPISVKNIKKNETVYGRWDFIEKLYTLNYVIVSTENPVEDKTDEIPNTVENIVFDTDEDIADVITTTDTEKNGVPGTWTFSGWYETPDCTGTPITEKNIQQNEAVYGKWDFVPDTYKLDYVIVSTENPVEDKTDAIPETVTGIGYDANQDIADVITTTDTEKDGVPGTWTFSGWYETIDCTGTPIDVKNIKKDETVYGKWDFVPNTYKLDYVIVSTENPSSDKTDEAPDTVENILFNTDENIAGVLKTTAGEKDGIPGTWKFIGWYETPDCTGKPVAKKNIKQDETVYGKWVFTPNPIEEPTTEVPTTKPGKPAETGDDFNPINYAIIMFISGLAVVVAYKGRKKSEQ